MGSVFLRNRTYWIQYFVDGKPKRESAKTRNEQKAKKFLSIREGQIREGIIPEMRKVTLDELLNDVEVNYLNNGLRSIVRMRISRKHLLNYFGNCKLSLVNGGSIAQYIQTRKDAGKTLSTIGRELCLLKRALNLGKQNRKVTVVPYIPSLAESEPRQGFVEYPQYLSLLKVLPDYLQLPLSLGFNLGMRLGEILNVEWDQVDFLTNKIRLTPDQCKNKTGRTVPLMGDLKERIPFALAERNLHHPDCLYVCHHNGKKIADFRKAWALATGKAGLKGLLFHDLRRSAVRNMVRAGVPERIAMSITGHKTRQVFDRYNIVNEDDLQVAAKKLNTFLVEEADRDKTDTTIINVNNVEDQTIN